MFRHLLQVSIRCGQFTVRRSFSTQCVKMSGQPRLLGQQEAQAVDEELFTEYQFSVDQLMEVAGLSVADVIVECYPAVSLGKDSPSVLICCGPGNNGGDGLVAARHLLCYGYSSTVFYPKRTAKPLYQGLTTQCQKMGATFIDNLPTTDVINSTYDVVVDALFGFSFKGAPRPPFDTVLTTLCQITRPLVSVDIPSGWHVEDGDTNDHGLKPETLISLTAPKKCATHFKGKNHYLGMRLVPQSLATKYNLQLPPYKGTSQFVKL
ncbi:NAD(P)H-hydrate epimerase-like isoform X2 [Dysidea avara]|uniref:NAD(P)H-hydrate epimerase-like isoform X2 n=1 Tax=Dysidea avara TaxID=196820 RepID=UPI003321AA97